MADYAAIKKQVEFYFSDSNFRKDAFLRGVAETDPEGNVPISTLLTFKKLQALTTNPEDVAKALKESDIVGVSEDGLKMRRLSDLPTNDTSADCTLYVKGFPLQDADVTIEAVNEQFSAYGRVCMVKLRKDIRTKEFRGSAFIEYAEPESVAKAVAAGNQGEQVVLGFKGNPYLCIMSLNQWLANKAAKKEKLAAKSKSGDAEDSGSVNKRKRGDEDTGDSNTVQFTPGLILKLENIPADCTLYQIKDTIKVIGDMKYVEYENGSTTAFVRMGSKEGAEKVLKSIADNALQLNGVSVTGAALSGDDELHYWEKIGSNSGAGKKQNKGGRGGRGWGKRGGKRR